MWTSVLADDGRVYYWNSKTDEVCWEMEEHCHKALLQAIDVCDDLRVINTNRSVQTCLRIGLDFRLRRALREWKVHSFYPPEVRVKTIVSCLDAWFKLKRDRDMWKRVAQQELKQCERDMDVMNNRISILMKSLVVAKLHAATTEYERLQSKAKVFLP